MRRRMMKSKIHRATVTDANLHYVGSITLDPDLMARADIREYEQVAVLDIDNGARFETYAIPGEPGRGLPQRRGRPPGPPGRQGHRHHLRRLRRRRARRTSRPRSSTSTRGNRPVTLDEAVAAVGLTADALDADRSERRLSRGRPAVEPLDLLVLGSGVAGLSAAVPRPPAPTACGSAC